MKTNDPLKYEFNSNVYSRLLKREREKKKEIRCGHCPYHKKENKPRIAKRRSWKLNRRSQYK